MQSEPIISVENLSKRYQLGVARQNERYTALRDVVAQKARNLFRSRKSAEADEAQAGEFWALRGVSFEVGRGEVVGIIGRNGAGKSTLLKILSRITEPTGGRITLRGRVASLLEVGTGFHPELTGRENIYLNGAILGMHRAEIRAKFEEIVAFAEVERFLDTPVKRYSSGMYVRLAFAVAAHLEPEILIVDEVLAVGDADFQKKCLGKMQQVAQGQGRTVLFVSHNMGAVRALCQHAVLLQSGSLIAMGSSAAIIDQYSKYSKHIAAETEDLSRHRRCGTCEATVQRVRTKAATTSDDQRSFLIGEAMQLEISYKVSAPVEGTFFALIVNAEGTIIISTFQKDTGVVSNLTVDGKCIVDLPSVELRPGDYTVSVGILDKKSLAFYEWIDYAAEFEVHAQFDDDRPYDQRLGILSIQSHWNVTN